MGLTVKESYQTGHDQWTKIPFDYGNGGTITALAQTFTAESSYSIGMVKLRLFRIGSPGTLTAAIYAVDGSDLPTGSALCSGTTNGNSLTTDTSGSIRSIFFSTTAELTNAVKYAIVLTAPSGNAGNLAAWRWDLVASYAGGQYLVYNNLGGAIWTDGSSPNGDFMFSTWVVTYAEKATTPNPNDNAAGISIDLAEITWADGGGGTQFYDVYFGPIGDVSYVAFVAVGDESYTIPSQLDSEQEYEWRIDSYNGSQITTGDTWSFTTGRQINLSSPTDTDTDIVMQPLLQWTIDGAGAQEGDLLDIYLRKDDSNFTEDDLLAGLVDATLNSSLQIVGGLEYNSTYYWQVQAAASTGGDLVSSTIYSFTTLVFAPPAVSLDGSGNPTGVNNMITIKRLVVAANNKIWWES